MALSRFGSVVLQPTAFFKFRYIPEINNFVWAEWNFSRGKPTYISTAAAKMLGLQHTEPLSCHKRFSWRLNCFGCWATVGICLFRNFNYFLSLICECQVCVQNLKLCFYHLPNFGNAKHLLFCSINVMKTEVTNHVVLGRRWNRIWYKGTSFLDVSNVSWPDI